MNALCVIVPVILLIGLGFFMVYALCAAAAGGDAMIEDALRRENPPR